VARPLEDSFSCESDAISVARWKSSYVVRPYFFARKREHSGHQLQTTTSGHLRCSFHVLLMLATVSFWSLEQMSDRQWGKTFRTSFPILHGEEWLAAGDCVWEGEYPCLQHGVTNGVPRPARISCAAVRLNRKRYRKRAPSSSNITAYRRRRGSDGEVDRKA
jgi:hypothetical protein